MPALSKAIEGSGYHPEGNALGFHWEDMSVVMESRIVTIIGAETEIQAKRVIDWLTSRL
jgi:hypothetical protein